MDTDEDKNIAKGTTDLGVEFFHQRNCVKVREGFTKKKVAVLLDFEGGKGGEVGRGNLDKIQKNSYFFS